MIADQLRKLYAYNTWAWQRLFASVEQLDEPSYKAEQPFFWGSLHKALVHCLSAEYVWLARCQDDSGPVAFQPDELENFAAVRQRWDAVQAGLHDFLATLTDEDCSRLVEYRNARGRGFSLPLADILQHLINHATEHRSQLTPLLYNLNVPTPGLDYMRFLLRP